MKREILIRNAEKEDVRQIAEILVEDWQIEGASDFYAYTASLLPMATV